MAYRNNWGNKKHSYLKIFLESANILEINSSLVDDYIEIESFSQGRHKTKVSNFSAKSIGKNDLWIAATAKKFNLTLITVDNDFNHLSPDFIKILNPAQDKF